MYIIKYAWLNLKASFFKNLLTGVIVLAIAFAACISLSIQDAANQTRETELAELSVSANIRIDRNYAMQQMDPESFNRDEANTVLGDLKGLTLEEYLSYAEAKSVSDFYYTETIYLDSNDDLEPIGYTADPFNSVDSNSSGGHPGAPSAPTMSIEKIGDFTIIGYSCDEAMTDFQNGVKKIKEGEVFAEGTEEYCCLISENLALYNSLAVGDTIQLARPDDEEVFVELTIVGTYSNQTDAEYNTTREDPDNEILISTALLGSIVDSLNEDVDKEEESDKIIETVVTGIYSFESADKFYEFEEQVKELGLTDKYTVVSNDIATYEASLLPLENLKDYAQILLMIVLAVGSVVLIFLSAINVNNRKKEIGTLAALGMSRFKVAVQYILEISTVMIIFVSIGTMLGSVAAVPVTNELLSSQVALQESQQQSAQQNFGRQPGMMQPSAEKPVGGDVEGEVNYIDEIIYTIDFQVIFRLIVITVGLALISSLTSIVFLLYNKPVKILTSSD